MKKAVKGIIGLCAALAVLGGGLAALKLTEPEDGGDSSSQSSSEVSGAGITLIKDEAISKIKVKNEAQEFTAVVKTEASESSSAVYTIEGYEDIPLTASMVGTLANNARGLLSDSIVAENCDELDKYGLEAPRAEAEITFESGETLTFEVGDISPVSSETYFKLGGSNTVYTVSTSKLSNYTAELNDFISSTVLEEPDEESYPKVNGLRIQRGDLDYDIYLEYDEKSDDADYTGGTSATHIMREPTFSYLAAERSAPITNGLFGLTSEGVYSVHPGEAEIAEAGLNDPFCTVTMSCDDGNDYVFLMSEPFSDEDGTKCHYAMFKDGNIIYIVSAEDAQWGTVMPIDVASKILFGTYVWDISDMKVKCSGADEINFVITAKDPDKDNSSAKSEDYDITMNGEVFDSERYRQFYAFLVQASAEEFALDAEIPEGEPIASIEFFDSYTNVTQKVEFYEYSSLSALIVINGESKYTCGKSFAETIAENAKRIETGEDYITTWK